MPDRRGHSANVVLGFPTLADDVAKNSPFPAGGSYFGSIIGRYGNRIANGTFTLDGVTYHLPINGVTTLAAPWRRAGSRQSSCSTIV